MTYVYVYEHEDVCDGVCGSELCDGGGGVESCISVISEMVDNLAKRYCSATAVPSREFVTQTDKPGKHSFRRSDRWVITVRVWWLWHCNLILRNSANLKNQYNIENKIAADVHGLNNFHTHTVDIEYILLTYSA